MSVKINGVYHSNSEAILCLTDGAIQITPITTTNSSAILKKKNRRKQREVVSRKRKK